MARWIVEDVNKTVLDKLDDDTRRQIRRKMVENAAKVLIKEMKATIESRHHVVSGSMEQGVAATKVYEDVGGTSIDVYPQGTDPRGVSNEMKAKIINYGYYNRDTGYRIKKRDYFLNDKFRKKCAPRIQAVMNETFAKCMEELNGRN